MRQLMRTLGAILGAAALEAFFDYLTDTGSDNDDADGGIDGEEDETK